MICCWHARMLFVWVQVLEQHFVYLPASTPWSSLCMAQPLAQPSYKVRFKQRQSHNDVCKTIQHHLLLTSLLAPPCDSPPQVNLYQNQCKQLPKALREWPAYLACRRTIDDFLEMLPLFQALTHKSMRERHWQEVMRVTGKNLNLAEDVFKLQVKTLMLYWGDMCCDALCKLHCVVLVLHT